jgi:hypothetical protein
MFEQDANLLHANQEAAFDGIGQPTGSRRAALTAKARLNAVRAAFNRMSDDEVGQFVQGLRQKGYIRRG